MKKDGEAIENKCLRERNCQGEKIICPRLLICLPRWFYFLLSAE